MLPGLPEAGYRGRFAPTPSGPLHFGSLVAALGSYLDARVNAGTWSLRIEDVDPPRVVPGAEAAILRTLEGFGFEWDGTVIRQSERSEAYAQALQALHDSGRLYACTCTRKQLGEVARRGIDGPVYPGVCRARSVQPHSAALRVRVDDERMVFADGQQGTIGCNVASECGDFVLRRADGVYAYQLAVVVDDAAQGITHVVRGADLLTSTPRQMALQQMLGLATPAYLHLPVVLDAQGQKLSKQTLAAPVEAGSALSALLAALHFLGGRLDATPESLEAFWSMAPVAWSTRKVVPIRGRQLPAQA